VDVDVCNVDANDLYGNGSAVGPDVHPVHRVQGAGDPEMNPYSAPPPEPPQQSLCEKCRREESCEKMCLAVFAIGIALGTAATYWSIWAIHQVRN
jgi:hypothetical protein